MDTDSEEWPALGHRAAGRGVHVRFDAPTPMDRDVAPPSRALPRARADRAPGLAPAAPRWDPRLGGFPPRGRGRGHDGGYQHRHRRDASRVAARPLADPAEAARRGLDRRTWVPTPPDDDAREEPIFRVMSYNILAASLAAEHPELYRGVDARVMRQSRRRSVLVKEIEALAPDVLLLQENESFPFLQRELGRRGYDGAHAPRGGGKLDGSSVFFRRDAFERVDFEAIDFENAERGLKHNAAAIMTLRRTQTRVRDSDGDTPSGPSRPDNNKNKTQIVVVGCVHGLFNPRRGDVKLGQMRVFVDAVARARAAAAARAGVPVERVHCVLGGDFNCAPSSPLYHFLSKGFLDIDRVDRRALAGSLAFRGASEKNADALADEEFAMLIETGGFDRDDDEWAAWDELRGVRGGSERIETRLRRYFWDDDATRAATGRLFGSRFPTKSETRTTDAPKNLRVAHALRGALASCYRTVSADGEEAPVTSWHARFKGTVDYLFHTKGIRTRRVLMPPKSAKDGALPSQEFASDHFCVVADVAFERER